MDFRAYLLTIKGYFHVFVSPLPKKLSILAKITDFQAILRQENEFFKIKYLRFVKMNAQKNDLKQTKHFF